MRPLIYLAFVVFATAAPSTPSSDVQIPLSGGKITNETLSQDVQCMICDILNAHLDPETKQLTPEGRLALDAALETLPMMADYEAEEDDGNVWLSSGDVEYAVPYEVFPESLWQELEKLKAPAKEEIVRKYGFEKYRVADPPDNEDGSWDVRGIVMINLAEGFYDVPEAVFREEFWHEMEELDSWANEQLVRKYEFERYQVVSGVENE